MPQNENPTDQTNKKSMRVRGGTDASKLAGAIVGHIDRGFTLCLETMGAGSLNQGIKGVIIANTMLAASGRRIEISPTFANKVIESAGEHLERSAIRLYLKVKHPDE